MRFDKKFVKRNGLLIVGIAMLVTVVAASLLAPIVAPYDPVEVDISRKMEEMSRSHLFGTDFWGRDIFSRVIFGGRYSLIVGIGSIGLSAILGIACGVLAGYYPGSLFGKLVIWVTDIIMSFPTLILGAMVAMMFGPGIFNTIVALAAAFFPRFIRLARSATLAAKEEVYVMAAKSIGMSDLRLLALHLIPNIISPVVVMAVIWTSDAISLEVALSFLGLGVPPPTPSWGNILQDNLRYFVMAPLPVIWPCVAVAWTVQSLNLIGDRFRDILDPRMR